MVFPSSIHLPSKLLSLFLIAKKHFVVYVYHILHVHKHVHVHVHILTHMHTHIHIHEPSVVCWIIKMSKLPFPVADTFVYLTEALKFHEIPFIYICY